jgi:hypothetical protein
MRYIENEKGNAAIYMLWLLGIVAVIFVLTVNIVKVYVVKEHANLAVEQAALAGTSVLLDKTMEAVEEFDSSPNLDFFADRDLQRIANEGKSIGQLLEERQSEHMAVDMDEADAYIKAANEILPENIKLYSSLRKEMKNKLGLTSPDLNSLISPTILDAISKNDGRTEQTEIEISTEKWRVEVKSSVQFEALSDQEFISRFVKDIPQKGYGPSLVYLKDIYTN